MKNISLCMIVKDEELVLGRCLDSVKDLVDEIIIVDTGSIDNTKKIARLYTDKIYDFQWINDFSAARNFSFSKATKDYIMWIDADDVLLLEDKIKLKYLKETIADNIDMVIMKYNVAFDKNGKPTFSYNRERWFKNTMNYLWSGKVHEAIGHYGNILYFDAAITHKKVKESSSDRNLRIYEDMLSKGKVLEPREEFYYARELMYNNKLKEAIKKFEEFINNPSGWIENKICACKDLSQCLFKENREVDGLTALFRSFQFDEPRAEICCDIGYYFLKKEEYKKAIFWYELCLNRNIDSTTGGFILNDCYDYIPYMQLCVCYDRIGDKEKAFEYNKKAGLVKPYDESYLYNKNYFNNYFNIKD